MINIVCPSCSHSLSVKDEYAGKSGACPRCGARINVPSVTPIGSAPAPAADRQIDPNKLRDPRERIAFAWLIALSIPGAILLFLLVVGFCAFIPFVLLGLLVRWVAGYWVVAYIKTNAIKVSERQFADIHRLATAFSSRLGKKTPEIYVMQHSVWNSVAMRIARKRIVVLFSGAVDSLLLKGSMTQLAWLVGHELGHHHAGHLNLGRRFIEKLGSWFIHFGLWYKRRCELTCDRYGLACAGSLSESLRAICNMTVGAQLASQVDITDAIAQWNEHRSEFFVKYRTLYSTHPHHLWRLDALVRAAQEIGIADEK